MSYLGPTVLDIIDDLENKLAVKLITYRKTAGPSKSFFIAYKAFKAQYKNIELRTLSSDIHDRFVICDQSQVFHFGHSLKDLGTKDAQITKADDPKKHIILFNTRWNEASEI